MLQLLLITNTFLVAVYIFFYTVDFLRVIQFREYRWDRFKDYLTTYEGRAWLYDKWRILAFLITFFWLFIRFLKIPTELTLGVLTFFFGAGYLISLSRKLITQNLYRPVRTRKVLLMAGLILLPTCYVLSTIYFYGYSREEQFYMNLVAILFVFIWSFLVWGIVELFKKIYLKKLQSQIINKLKNRGKLKIIVIVGAIGKSSQKNYLGHILKSKYKVLTTPGNVNSEIGVFKFLLKQDLSKYDFLVLEVGAYKLGEVEFIVKALKPNYAIYTGYSIQHLALYGSKKNILLGDFEALDYLQKDGKAYVNIDHQFKEFVMEEVKHYDFPIETFSLEDKHAKIILNSAKHIKNGYEITISYNGEKYPNIKVPIYHRNHLSNVIAVIAFCIDLGISLPEIKSEIINIKPPKSAMRIETKAKMNIIWDEYNSTLEGTLSSLDTLESINKQNKKICVFSGIFELGEEKKPTYQIVASKMGKICDKILCTSEDAYYSLIQSKGRSLDHKLILDLNGNYLKHLIGSKKDFDILIEGKIFARWRNPL